MDKVREKSNSRFDKLYTFLLFLGIYFSHDTVLFGTNSNISFINFGKMMPFFIIAVLFFPAIKGKVQMKVFLVLSLMLVFPFFSCLTNNEDINNYIYRIAIIFAAALMVRIDKKGRFFDLFTKLMVFFCVASLFFWLLGNLIPTALYRLPTVKNVTGYIYHNALLTLFSFDGRFLRNAAFFREPGVFVVFIVFAMIIELTFKKKTKMMFVVIYTITILTTLSTAGYIILGAIYIYILLHNKSLKSRYILCVFIVIAMLLIVNYTNLLQSDSTMFSKFQKGSNNYGSWLARLSSLTQNIKIAMTNPFFGVGRYALYDIVLADEGAYRAVDNTNTILITFAAFGIIYGGLNVYCLWKFAGYKKNWISALTVFFILFTVLSNEDMGQNIVYYIVIFYGLKLSSNDNPSRKRKRGNYENCIT